MEMDVLGGGPVHLGLRRGQELEDREGMLRDGGREPASLDQLADLAKPAVIAMVSRVRRSLFRALVEVGSIANRPTGTGVVMKLAVVVMVIVSMAVIVIAMVVMPLIVPMTVVVVAVMVVVPVVVVAVMMPMTVVVPAMVMWMAVPMVVLVVMLLGFVHRASAAGVEHVELGTRDAAAGYLSRPQLNPLHPESSHVAPDHVQARPQIEESAHEHVAAHPRRRVEVKDARHVELSPRPLAASLLIMFAW